MPPSILYSQICNIQDSLDQYPMLINASQNHGIDLKLIGIDRNWWTLESMPEFPSAMISIRHLGIDWEHPEYAKNINVSLCMVYSASAVKSFAHLNRIFFLTSLEEIGKLSNIAPLIMKKSHPNKKRQFNNWSFHTPPCSKLAPSRRGSQGIHSTKCAKLLTSTVHLSKWTCSSHNEGQHWFMTFLALT